MIKKFDYVVLIVDIPEYKLHKGNIGEVTSVFNSENEFEVKFLNIIGEVAAVIRLIPEQFRKINTIRIPYIKYFNMN